MGMRIKNRGRIGVELEKYAKRSTRALRRVQAEGAQEIAEVAEQMAPFKKGDLESSFVVEREKSGRRTNYVVRSNNVPYALKMHEEHYNLGPGSLQKDSSGSFVVGRKYLSRAVNYVVNDLKLIARARQAVRKK